MDRLAGERPARPGLRRASSHLGLLRASRGILLHLFCRFFFIHCGFFFFFYHAAQTNCQSQRRAPTGRREGGWRE